MPDRPVHLTRENAARFQDQSVVDAYPLRAPYPPEIIDRVVDLVHGAPGAVLDIGTGTGELARPLAARVARVDALDASAAMIAAGKRSPGGDRANLRWIEGRAEDEPVHPPYDLITAGDSLHWMEWEAALPRFHDLLTPDGLLAIVHRSQLSPPWHEGLGELIETYSTMKNFLRGFDLIQTLETRHLFVQRGTFETPPVECQQAVEEYIRSFHSRSSLSTETMPPEDVLAFDEKLRQLVLPFSEDGHLTLRTIGSIVWGRPLAGQADSGNTSSSSDR